jgi:hypothetical protein
MKEIAKAIINGVSYNILSINKNGCFAIPTNCISITNDDKIVINEELFKSIDGVNYQQYLSTKDPEPEEKEKDYEIIANNDFSQSITNIVKDQKQVDIDISDEKDKLVDYINSRISEEVDDLSKEIEKPDIKRIDMVFEKNMPDKEEIANLENDYGKAELYNLLFSQLINKDGVWYKIVISTFTKYLHITFNNDIWTVNIKNNKSIKDDKNLLTISGSNLYGILDDIKNNYVIKNTQLMKTRTKNKIEYLEEMFNLKLTLAV